MTVIKVAVDDDDLDSSRYAPAVMAAILTLASNPLPLLPMPEKWSKPEKTLPQNPNRLTRKQHVFPVRSIKRFINQRGCVTVFDMTKGKEYPAGPTNIQFCAQRAWDQQTEAAMTQIEDRFQKVVQPIVQGQVNTIAPEYKSAIDFMFALWFMRAHFRGLAAQELQLFGIPGYNISKAHEEHLEMHEPAIRENRREDTCSAHQRSATAIARRWLCA